MSKFANIFELSDFERESVCRRLFGAEVSFHAHTSAVDLFKEMEDFSATFQFSTDNAVQYAIKISQRYGRQWLEGEIREDNTVTKIPMMRCKIDFTDEEHFIPQLLPHFSPFLQDEVMKDLNHYLLEMATYPNIRIGGTRLFFDNVIGRLKYLRERDINRIESMNENLFRDLFTQEVGLSLSGDEYQPPKTAVVDILFKDIDDKIKVSYVVKRDDPSAQVVANDIERRLKELTKDNPPKDFREEYHALREVLNAYNKSHNNVKMGADWSY